MKKNDIIGQLVYHVFSFFFIFLSFFLFVLVFLSVVFIFSFLFIFLHLFGCHFEKNDRKLVMPSHGSSWLGRFHKKDTKMIIIIFGSFFFIVLHFCSFFHFRMISISAILKKMRKIIWDHVLSFLISCYHCVSFFIIFYNVSIILLSFCYYDFSFFLIVLNLS